MPPGEPAGDRITLDGIVFWGRHGVHAPERALGQRFEVDLAVWLDLAPAGERDDPALTVDYGRLYTAARDVVEGEPVSLIETVAARLAARILADFPVDAVRVRLRKPWAPVGGMTAGAAGVEIVRRRLPPA